MESDEVLLQILAEEQGVTIATLQSLLAAVRAQTAGDRFYIFWTAGPGGAGGRAGQRQRTLLAFPTADTALAFAQLNRLGQTPGQLRLRCLSLLQLILAVLREPAISALLLIAEQDGQLPAAGHLPTGVRIERADLLRRLQGDPAI